jgi:class 3 adenylate cyclase
MGGVSGRTFTHDFGGPLPAVWGAMADTARYNAAAALPKQTITETPGPAGDVRFIARAKVGGMALEWEDLPCNWVREHWFEHRRRFTKGPLAVMDARLDLSPAPEGCHGDYRLEVAPNGLLGRLLIAGGFLRSAERMFKGLAEQADRFARGERAVPFVPATVPVTGAARARLETLAQKLEAGPYGHGLGERLVALVAEGLEVDVERIRPIPLARRWGVPERHVIEACLEATRLGMLELRWDLLCPRCRGAKATAGTLDQVPTGAHCGTCNIDYARNFSRNVELVLRPAPSIRPIEGGEFCLLGPMSTPHIWVHVTVEAGEERDIEVQLTPGPYRLRTLEFGPEADIEYDGGPFPAVVVTDGWVMAGPPSPPGKITLRNRSAHRRTFVVEDRRWVADALTADRMATLQAFRDLFSTEVLRPGDDVAIGRVTLLFSDLKGSTAMYEAVGDAAAYRLVRAHFAYLAAIIREHDGAIVKTIGDAVMAAFHDPLQGLRCAIAMQERVAEFNARNPQPIVLKLGLHEGPCIAVTLNDRLDYFGQTVNLAARLQGESEGGDIVVSAPLAEMAGAPELLARHRSATEHASLRGVSEPVAFVRLFIEPA